MGLVITDTDIGVNTSDDWIYSQLKIDLTKITSLRFAIYDNESDLKPLFAKKRYRAELQLYEDNPQQSKYKLHSFISNYTSYKNNKWKRKDDTLKDWYIDKVNIAKDLDSSSSTLDCAVGHCNLKNKEKHPAGKGYGNYDVPMYAMNMIHTGNEVTIFAHIEDETFKVVLDQTSDKVVGAKLYYKKVNVKWQE